MPEYPNFNDIVARPDLPAIAPAARAAVVGATVIGPAAHMMCSGHGTYYRLA